MPIAQSVRARITEIATGGPFLIDALGNRAAIGRALSRLVRAGEIKRVVPGVCVKPEISARFGEVPISPEQVARAMVKARGGVIQMSGGEAANWLRLSKHVPMQSLLLISGRTRTIKVSGRTCPSGTSERLP